MFKILKYLKLREWIMIAISVVFIVVQVWFDLKLPEYMSEITTLTQTEGSEMSDIWLNGGYMMLCALGSIVSSIVIVYFASKVAATLSQRLRSLLFHKVESFSMEEISRFSTSSLITRSSNDITQVQMFFVMALQLAIKSPIMAVWAMTKISSSGAEFTMIVGIALAVIVVTVLVIMILVIPKFKKMQVLMDNITRVTRENLTGLRVVRAYNAEDYQEEKFNEANQVLTNTQMFTNKSMSLMLPVLTLVMNGLSLAIYWVGAYMIQEAAGVDKLTIFSDMVVFSSYAVQVIMSFIMLVMIFIMFPRASVAANRINEVLDTETKIHDGELKKGKAGIEGEVVFNNVTFTYPNGGKPVLQDVSFKASKGETVAFIGSTGSGKSSLINLVPRFFDATKGEVLVDGVNVKEYDQISLRNKIGYVPQKAVLFKGSVSSNVTYGENGRGNYSKEDIKTAIRIAQGTEFVEKMDKKYDAHIAQGGTNVSGGQKQRLSIARAVCRKPEIYIFDDSFSALDYKTDRVLRSVLKKETAGVTSLIVAQRIGTIMDADQIIVLDEGKVVGKGKHKELLKSCEVYKEIAMSQLSEEELA